MRRLGRRPDLFSGDESSAQPRISSKAPPYIGWRTIA
jgi:hypothetical protein